MVGASRLPGRADLAMCLGRVHQVGGAASCHGPGNFGVHASSSMWTR